MKTTEKYDVLILGSGAGGKVMAWTMAKEGQRTAVVERKYVGGSCPNIACLLGECAGSPYFTHVSEDDFAIVHDNLNGGNRSTADRLIPYCVFTDPELARVGLNESEARAKGVAYRFATVPVDSSWRPWTLSERRGFMKTLIDTRTDRILGFTAFGPEAGELMSTVQVAMLAGLPYTLLRDTMFAHPTMTEGLRALFMAVPQVAEAHAGQVQQVGS